MRRFGKIIGKGLKYISLVGIGSLVCSAAYLQYINSQIGAIQIERDLLVKYYMQKQKMQEKQANNMYYWVLFDIAMMRIFTYHTYSSYCSRFNKRIVTPSLQRYEDKKLYTKIGEINQKSDGFKRKALFKEVNLVRNQNMKGISDNEFIIKELRKQQKLMDTRHILGLEEDQLKKIEVVHKYVCKAGAELKDAEVLEYLRSLPTIESKLPGDIVHKIMFI